MRLTTEDTVAKMLKQFDERLNNVESESGTETKPILIRVIDETETSADTVSSSIDSNPGWVWGESEWGFDPWN